MIGMKKWVIYISALTVLAGCTGSNVRNTLGLNRRSPDAFSVVSRPPLTVPKEFNLVAPGSEASAGVAGESAKDKARALLLKQAQPAGGSQAAIEEGGLAAQLRERAGVATANASVRKELDQEHWEKEQAKDEGSVMDLFSKGLQGDDDEDEVLNADLEAQRLKAQASDKK
jgi:hypothetical protein